MDKDTGIKVRKEQLKKLDEFVHDLYKEVEVFEKYGADLRDIKMLYVHIHELINELLQVDSTEEFMKMIEDLHKAIAGILIVVAPAKAGQVKKDMHDSYEDFKGENFDDMLNNLTKTASQKYSNKPRQENKKEDEDEDPNNNPDELMDILDLKNHVNQSKSKKKKKEDSPLKEFNPDADPFRDVYKKFNE